MTKLTKFVEAFWGPEFTSTVGFDLLCRRMKCSRKASKEFEDFLKQLVKIESSYSQALLKLSRSVDGADEVGTIRDAWKSLRAQMELFGESHAVAHNCFSDQYSQVQSFNDEQKDVRKKTEDSVKKYQTNKNQLYQKTMSLQKSYRQKCQEKDSVKEQYYTVQQIAPAGHKDIEKVQSKFLKAEQNMELADIAYKSSLVTLEEARASWEGEMAAGCETFQNLEETRINFLREQMWILTNIASTACVSVDDSCEVLRQTLEKCKIDADINLFIEQNKSGTERPAPVLYENYYASQKNGNSNQGGTLTRPPRPAEPLPNHRNQRPLPIPANQSHDDEAYAGGDPGFSIFNVRKSYTAKGVHELSVRTNDRVRVIKKMDSKHLQVQLEGTKKCGIIPLTCIDGT